MSASIPAATKAVQDYLESIMQYDDEVIATCHELLESIWQVDDARIRMQIIETAAFNVGFLDD